MIDPSRTDIPEPAIHALVHAFYARVREDALLAPVFASRIEAWDPHLDRMTLFWRAVLHGEAVYRPDRGSPRELHRRLDAVTHAHFDRWLELFEQTAFEVFEPGVARAVVERARRIAVPLSSHLGPRPTVEAGR